MATEPNDEAEDELDEEREKPCAGCPFRSDVPVYLGHSRVQKIAAAVAEYADFKCPNAGAPSEENYPVARTAWMRTANHCVGAHIFLLKIAPKDRMLWLLIATGHLRPEDYDLEVPVFETLEEFVQHHAKGFGGDAHEPPSE